LKPAHAHEPLLSPAVSLRRHGVVEALDVHDSHRIVLGLDGSMEMAVDGIGLAGLAYARIDRWLRAHLLTLLDDPRSTLSDVALQVGFGDQSAFTHAFTRRFGRAPGQWRPGRH